MVTNAQVLIHIADYIWPDHDYTLRMRFCWQPTLSIVKWEMIALKKVDETVTLLCRIVVTMRNQFETNVLKQGLCLQHVFCCFFLMLFTEWFEIFLQPAYM